MYVPILYETYIHMFLYYISFLKHKLHNIIHCKKKKKAYLVSVHLWSIEHDPGGRRFHMEERLYHPVLLQCREVLH